MIIEITDESYRREVVPNETGIPVHDWVRRSDERLSQFPASVTVAKQLKAIWQTALSWPYTLFINAEDLILDESYAADIEECQRALNTSVCEAAARVAAVQIAMHSRGSRQDTLVSRDVLWLLILKGCMHIEYGPRLASELANIWIDAAKREFKRLSTTGFGSPSRLDLYCFDTFATTPNGSHTEHGYVASVGGSFA